MKPALIYRCLLSLLLGCASASVLAVDAGQVAPAFSAPLLQGVGKVEIERYRGKVLLVDFWASWCGPCRDSLPALEQLRGEYGARGFEVLAVNLDSEPRDGLDFLKKYPVTYPNVQDAEGRIARLFNVRAMPMSYLIDREGVVQHVHLGFNKKDVPRLRAAVAEMVREE